MKKLFFSLFLIPNLAFAQTLSLGLDTSGRVAGPSGFFTTNGLTRYDSNAIEYFYRASIITNTFVMGRISDAFTYAKNVGLWTSIVDHVTLRSDFNPSNSTVLATVKNVWTAQASNGAPRTPAGMGLNGSAYYAKLTRVAFRGTNTMVLVASGQTNQSGPNPTLFSYANSLSGDFAGFRGGEWALLPIGNNAFSVYSENGGGSTFTMTYSQGSFPDMRPGTWWTDPREHSYWLAVSNLNIWGWVDAITNGFFASGVAAPPVDLTNIFIGAFVFKSDPVNTYSGVAKDFIQFDHALSQTEIEKAEIYLRYFNPATEEIVAIGDSLFRFDGSAGETNILYSPITRLSISPQWSNQVHWGNWSIGGDYASNMVFRMTNYLQMHKPGVGGITRSRLIEFGGANDLGAMLLSGSTIFTSRSNIWNYAQSLGYEVYALTHWADASGVYLGTYNVGVDLERKKLNQAVLDNQDRLKGVINTGILFDYMSTNDVFDIHLRERGAKNVALAIGSALGGVPINNRVGTLEFASDGANMYYSNNITGAKPWLIEQSNSMVRLGSNMTLTTSIAVPTVRGTNNCIMWASNNTLFLTWTAGGTTTNTIKIAGP